MTHDVGEILTNLPYPMSRGDVILTGTPGGTALNFRLIYILTCRGKEGFIEYEEKNNKRYLQKRDLVISKSRNLGVQGHIIK